MEKKEYAIIGDSHVVEMDLAKEIKEKIALSMQGEPVYKYNDNGELVSIDDIPLTRKQRREIARAKERRIKKLKRLKFQVDREKEKLERAENSKTEGQTESSSGE